MRKEEQIDNHKCHSLNIPVAIETDDEDSDPQSSQLAQALV